MPFNIQFSFLGPQNNYYICVTRVSGDGIPQEPEKDWILKTFGLPDAFRKEYSQSHYKRQLFFNLRGHDVFSYSGQYKGRDPKSYKDEVVHGYVEASRLPVTESALLESLRRQNRGSRIDELNFKTTYGPKSGSVFADAYDLKRYRWANLPKSLEEEIQNLVCDGGYGNGQKSGQIYELAMNATGGWVMLFEEGKKYKWGGVLPPGLEEVLKGMVLKKRKTPKLDVSIYRVYLNHQNPREYVLLFNDGQSFVHLHSHFEDDMRVVLRKWAEGNGLKNEKFNFTSSSNCDALTGKTLNATYYSERGRFFLSRLNVPMAMKYFRQASSEDRRDVHVRDNRFLGIVAMKKPPGSDPILESQIQHRQKGEHTLRPPVRSDQNDDDAFFHDEYLWMLEVLDSLSEEPEKELAERRRRLGDLQRPYLNAKFPRSGSIGADAQLAEWSYEMISPRVLETPIGAEIGTEENLRPGLAVRDVSRPSSPSLELDEASLSERHSNIEPTKQDYETDSASVSGMSDDLWNAQTTRSTSFFGLKKKKHGK